jgi:DNA-binding transcriptional LysR family regulator
MADLNALVLFAKVVEANSFSEAARRLNMPTSTVSRRVAELEDELGIRLLERSTRSLRLTEAGSEVFEQAQRSAELSESVDNLVSDQLVNVSGLLRLSAPPSLSDTLLAPLVGAFQAAYPAVRVQVLVADRTVDHIAEGIELMFCVGPLKNMQLASLKLLTYRHQLVASPSYLATRPAPQTPQDLLGHHLLAFSHWKPENRWTFVHVDGRARETVAFRPSLSMNDYSGLSAALLADGGIGDLPPLVRPELLREGRLVEVMPQWRFLTLDLSLAHLAKRHIARPVRLFKELAVQMAPALFPDLPA